MSYNKSIQATSGPKRLTCYKMMDFIILKNNNNKNNDNNNNNNNNNNNYNNEIP